jgi:microcystin-dependent protein
VSWPTWLTPDESGSLSCRSFAIPTEFLPIVRGAIAELENPYNWEEFGSLTPGECVTIAQDIADSESECSMIGQVGLFATQNLPFGWLPLDGSVYNRVDYPLLYAAIDAQYVIDADTFQTPAAEDVFPMLAGTAYSLGDSGGEAEHTLTTEEIPAHHHGIPGPSTFPYGTIPEVTVAGSVIAQNSGDTGGSEAHNNQPPFYAFKGGIRAK